MKNAQQRNSREAGSALLVALMVMVGLSLLGLAFVSISETESAISINERNYAQLVSIAETGARMGVEWFQDPEWAEGEGLLPQNIAAFKRDRWIDVSGTNTNIGPYKSTTGTRLFDKPFKPQNPHRLFGTVTAPDVLIDRTTSEGRTFLDNLNASLFPNALEDGEITEIRVYAPPIVGGTTTADPSDPDAQFISGGIRYGLATIMATAVRFDKLRATPDDTTPRPIAQRIAKIVISEWPFPGPQGPIQSNANIATGGNFGVHWGKMTSQEDMEVARPLVSLPWHSAWDRMHFEMGYNSSRQWPASTALDLNDPPIHPSPASIAAEPLRAKVAWKVTAAGTTGASEPAWPTAPTIGTTTVVDGTVTYTAQHAPNYKMDPTSTADNAPFLYELFGKLFEDPWFEARARGDITNEGTSISQPYQYTSALLDEIDTPTPGWSNWFQVQDLNSRPANKKEVIFPKIDYNFWKEIAQSAHGQSGVKYLRWVAGGAGDRFTDGTTTKPFAQWVNTRLDDVIPGFYFFDTQNAQNPQGPGAAGILTPEIRLNSADSGRFTAMGFIYLNSANFYTTGLTGLDGNYHNFPGEPYRDIGFRRVAEVDEPASGGNPAQVEGDFYLESGDLYDDDYMANNGAFDYQDLPWSNNGTSPNGKLDIYVELKTVKKADGTLANYWLPVPYTPGCVPGNNEELPVGTVNPCSEPHEPFTNIIYPPNAKSGGGPEPVQFGWQDPTLVTRRPKRLTATDTLPNCTTNPEMCTSNAWDRDGGLVEDLDPILDGVFYNEGDFRDTTGNAVYFGSLLINGNVGKAGTAEVWFDEKLIKGDWPPPRFNFPRVFISSVQTDQ